MGVRVHKSVGYGMRGFTPSPEFIERYRGCEATVADLIAWCREPSNEARILAHAEGDPTPFRKTMLKYDLEAASSQEDDSLTRYLEWSDEFAIPDVLFCVPLTHLKSWSRYDNTLDWVEETQFHAQENRFEPVEREIYPYDKGKMPLTVAALLLYFGVEHTWTSLHEALYVRWG